MIKTVGVIGASPMGKEIAHLFALHGFAVILCDISDSHINASLATIRKKLERQVHSGIISASDAGVIAGRIEATKIFTDLSEADFIVEAVSDDEVLKIAIFRALDEIARPGVVLATVTSPTTQITRIAAATGRPELVIGIRLMNPEPDMSFVEVSHGRATNSWPLPQQRR